MVVWAVSSLLGAGLRRGLEPHGQRLDRCRRSWFHPEREVAHFVESLLILALVWSVGPRYAWPAALGWSVFLLWALHLPADAWSWIRLQQQPNRTRELHQRGFLLLGLGPLWVRTLVSALAAAGYFFVGPVRTGLDIVMGFVVSRVEGWIS
jgi:hypothetical protein